MNQQKNIGKWTALIKMEGKAPKILINGILPAHIEKMQFHLQKKGPQGPVSTELTLNLSNCEFHHPVGNVGLRVQYEEVISIINQYNSVVIVDEQGERIARVLVIVESHN